MGTRREKSSLINFALALFGKNENEEQFVRTFVLRISSRMIVDRPHKRQIRDNLIAKFFFAAAHTQESHIFLTLPN